MNSWLQPHIQLGWWTLGFTGKNIFVPKKWGNTSSKKNSMFLLLGFFFHRQNPQKKSLQNCWHRPKIIIHGGQTSSNPVEIPAIEGLMGRDAAPLAAHSAASALCRRLAAAGVVKLGYVKTTSTQTGKGAVSTLRLFGWDRKLLVFFYTVVDRKTKKSVCWAFLVFFPPTWGQQRFFLVQLCASSNKLWAGPSLKAPLRRLESKNPMPGWGQIEHLEVEDFLEQCESRGIITPISRFISLFPSSHQVSCLDIYCTCLFGENSGVTAIFLWNNLIPLRFFQFISWSDLFVIESPSIFHSKKFADSQFFELKRVNKIIFLNFRCFL